MSKELSMFLIDCCRSGDIEGVKEILTHYKLSDFSTWVDSSLLLCEALKKVQTEVAKLLLQNEAKVNIKGYRRNNSLFCAAHAKNTEMVQILLDTKANINAKNKWGKTVLQLAVENNDLEIVNLLIRKGALDVVKKLPYYNLLDIAVREINYEILQLLLENITDPEYITIEEDENIDVNFDRVEQIKELECKEDQNCKEDITCTEVQSSPTNCSKIRIKDIVELDGNLKQNSNSLLHKAVLSNRNKINQKDVKKVVRQLLNNNFNVNARDTFGRTPLYYTCEHGQLELCKYLIVNGSTMEIKENLHIFHTSAERSNERLMEFLLEEGVDVNTKAIDNSTSLHKVCERGIEACVKLLLKYNADLKIKNIEGLNPLHVAVKHNHNIIVDLLLRNGSCVNATTTKNATPLHFAAQHCGIDILQILLESGADIKAEDNYFKTALCYAVEAGKPDMIRFLLDKNPDLQDISNKLAFCFAIVKGSSKNVAEPFLLREFTIQTEDFNAISVPEPLYSKYSKIYDNLNCESIFKDLLKREPSINGYFEYQVLYSSIHKGFLKIVKDLLRSDANVNTELDYGFNLLHIAIVSCQLSVAEELLKRGANVNCVLQDGNTLLHRAVLCSTDAVSFLLNHGINVHARNNEGDTPFHFAVGHYDCVKLLLEAGADVNSKNDNYFTPLHMAIGFKDDFEGELEDKLVNEFEDEFEDYASDPTIELLLEHDADVNLRNIDNHTPLDLAICSVEPKGLLIPLLNHGATYNFSNQELGRRSRWIFSVQTRHNIKLQAISDPNALTVCGNHNDFLLTCCAEIKKMIRCEIVSNVSMYDLLTKKNFEAELYMRNEQIVRFFESFNLENLYPVYFNLLRVRVDKAKRRNELIRLGISFLGRILLFKLITLPMVTENICSTFSNSDLRRLIFLSNIWVDKSSNELLLK